MDLLIIGILLIFMSGFGFVIGGVSVFLILKFDLLKKLKKNPPRESPQQNPINPYQLAKQVNAKKTSVYSEDYMEAKQ